MEPKLSLSLHGLSFGLCSTFVLAFPLDRNNSGPKSLKIGSGCLLMLGGHIYLLEVVSSVSLTPPLGILANVIPNESWYPLTSQVSGTF